MAKFIVVNGIRIASEFEAATHGRLTSIGPRFRASGVYKQVCECECGNVIVLRVCSVIRGNTKSCGCLYNEKIKKHGLRNHPLYETWKTMIKRCCNPKCTGYRYYGERGITVCDRWRESFENFLIDMGERPDGCTLDRIDNSKGYEPGNCKWSTLQEQQNNKSSNRMLIYNGKTQTMAQWERELGLPKHLLCIRIRNGWSVERALSEPVRGKRKAK